MNSLLFALIVAVLDTLLGFVGVFTFKLSRKVFDAFIYAMVAFAAGSLLGGAFFHLLPESIERGVEPLTFSIILICSFSLFLLLEDFLHWHRCMESRNKKNFINSDKKKPNRISSVSYLLLIGDFVHNFIDGVVLVGSVLISVPVGVVTSIMILAHELPEELGIFAVLVHGGMREVQSVYNSVIAQSSVVLGVILGYFVMRNSSWVPYLLPFAAGSFLYISASDLIPEINSKKSKERLVSALWLVVGIVFMLMIKLFE